MNALEGIIRDKKDYYVHTELALGLTRLPICKNCIVKQK